MPASIADILCIAQITLIIVHHALFGLTHLKVFTNFVNRQCVVYNYQCDLCDAEYVGYTSRHLHQRIDEHRSSAIGKHLKNDHGIKTIGDLNGNFSVLKKCGGKLDCLIYEMLFIKKKKPKLNTQSDSIRAKLFI